MSSEEADLLREMVADRDRRIVMVKQNTTDLDEKQQRLLDELDSATELTARQQITHQTEKTKLLHNLHLAADQLGHMEADLHQQGSSLASYANMVSQQHNDDGISPVTPSNVDQNTVMRMQAQLCKAMHSMGILDQQLQLTSNMCESRIKMQRDAMAEQRESKAQLELQLLNDMMRADTEKREAEDGLKKQIKDLQGQIKVLERELDEYEDEDEEKQKNEDEDEEEDEETMKAKEGIWKLLEQRREQVTDLEKHLDSQEVELSQLRETLGEDVVEAPEERPPPPKHAPPPLPENVDDSESEVNEEEEDDNKSDEVAARLAQVMENAKLEDVERAGSVHELDLLKMAQNRLAGASADEEEEEESSEEESDEEQEESAEEQDEEGEGSEGGGESTPPTQEELQSEAFESVEADPTLSVADDEEPAEVVNALSADRPAEMHDQPTDTIGALSSSACDEALQGDEVPEEEEEEEEEKKNPEEEELPTTGEKPAHNGVRHDENSETTEAAE